MPTAAEIRSETLLVAQQRLSESKLKRGRQLSLSLPRKFVCDLLAFAKKVPSVPMQRRMRLGDLVLAQRQFAAHQLVRIFHQGLFDYLGQATRTAARVSAVSLAAPV